MENSILLKATEEFGTPIYIYDGDKIRSQYQRLKTAFKPLDVHIHYAMKALNNINILRILKNEGAFIDAVSMEEVQLALRAGFAPEEILFTPNCVAFLEIKEAALLGVKINIDNLVMLEKFGAEFGSTIPCCVRINPHIMAGGNSNISVGHIDSKFGISIHQLKHITRITECYGIHINGLHMHTGSDILDPDVFLRGANLLYEAAMFFPELEFIDFGSGFKVAYKEGDFETNLEEVGRRISDSFINFCTSYGRNLLLIFEPGKLLVSDAGNFLVSANVVKQTTSTVFIGVNSGQNHLIRPMFYNAYHQIENISNSAGEKRLYTVVGNICETDTFGYDRMLNEVREGDVLAIRNAGAYGFSMSNQYNSRCRPAEVLYLDGELSLIRKKETLEDVYRNEIVVVE